MNDQLLNIWNDEALPDQQQLLDYIEGRLDEESKAALELQLAADPLLRDAVEGLAKLRDRSKLNDIKKHIDRSLIQRLKRRNRRMLRREKPNQLIIVVATVLLLMLTAIAWWVIHLLQKG